jgi:hypothetical protein
LVRQVRLRLGSSSSSSSSNSSRLTKDRALGVDGGPALVEMAHPGSNLVSEKMSWKMLLLTIT